MACQHCEPDLMPADEPAPGRISVAVGLPDDCRVYLYGEEIKDAYEVQIGLFAKRYVNPLVICECYGGPQCYLHEGDYQVVP